MSNLKEYVVVCAHEKYFHLWTKNQYNKYVSDAALNSTNPSYQLVHDFSTTFSKDSPYQGSAGVWVKASERLLSDWFGPVKYAYDEAYKSWEYDVMSGSGLQELLNYHPDALWLDDSAAAPAGDGEAIEILKELCWLKSHKDNVGKDSVYEQRQPEAWKRANEFLNSLIKTGKP